MNVDKEDSCMYTMEYYSHIKKRNNTFAAMQMDLEVIRLSKSEREKQIACGFIYIDSLVGRR